MSRFDIHERWRTIRAAAVLLLLGVQLAGCGSRSLDSRPSALDDRRTIPQPAEQKINEVADGFDNQITRQLEQFFDLSRHLRRLFNRPKQAKNIDSFGEVPNSTWFTNRNGVRPMTLDEIKRGPDQGTGPDMTGVWTIVRAKSAGVTPGFHIEDSRGDRYVLKFDPPGYAELATGAEVVCTKIFHAIGYNVPENYIVYFNPNRLALGDGVKVTDENGDKREMTIDDLNALLSEIERAPDGTIRGIASKYVPGKPIGPFRYRGIRKDDPNDIIPHQHRRELRGLRIFAAWLHHFDTKSGNSLDTYITRDGSSFVKHYLIDFGSTLGCAATRPVEPFMGKENYFDPHEISKSLLSLGFFVRPSERPITSGFRSVGHYSADRFEPLKYKFHIPNPAFENLTGADGFWAAKLVMFFTDAQLEAAVDEGRYSDPAAAAYLLKGLRERRDIIGRYWMKRMNSLDRFRVERDAGGEMRLCFDDLAVEAGYEEADRSEYRYVARMADRKWEGTLTGGTREFILPQLNTGPGDERLGDTNDRSMEVTLRIRRSPDSGMGKRIRVFLLVDENGTGYTLTGLRRDE